MAGYSGTPLAKKLGIKEGHTVAIVGAPKDFEKTLGELPQTVAIQAGLQGRQPLDVIVLFVTRRAELERRIAPIRKRMNPAAGLWVAWPKKASKVSTDMTDEVVRGVALPTGLVDNKVCAIDETWSGLRLVIRLEHREQKR
jgi:ABC-type Na+ transport system ATPase subunit NatA